MSKFGKLSKKIQEKEGYSKEGADAVVAIAGRKKLGAAVMEEKAEAGKAAKKKC